MSMRQRRFWKSWESLRLFLAYLPHPVNYAAMPSVAYTPNACIIRSYVPPVKSSDSSLSSYFTILDLNEAYIKAPTGT